MALPLATVTPILSLRRLQAPRSNCDAAAATRLSGACEAALFGLKFACCRATAVWDRRPKPARALMVEEGRTAATARIVTVVGDGSVSPLKNTPWEQVMRHTSTRLKWVDEGIEMVVFSDKATQYSDTRHENLVRELLCSDMLVHVAINDQESIEWLHKNSDSVPNIICFESSPDLRNKLGGSFVHKRGEENMFNRLVNIAKKGNRSESAEVLKTVSGAWERYNADDIRFCLLVIINSYIRPVSVLKNLRAKGLSTLNCMIKNCGSQMLNCLFDPNCRKALQCLNSCSPTDQVCNYRCIASYESPYLEAFSLCVLQKNNCLELDAEIPSKPIVTPLYMFRGELLSHEVAEDLFIGWLDNLEWSWRVIAGQNPAYDQFPCQYQLFYRGKAKGSFWYEPVFQVRTQEGTLVWRRRKYRVRRASVPGTFYFSVLDNGVVSKEFWTIIDVCDDLSWGLFQYNGAAQVAGLSYTGAVLVSPDGNFKPELGGQRLVSALEKCSIMDWELYRVDNCSCNNPPLGIPEGSRLRSKIELRNQRWVSQQLG
ncbi:violaxanthin de-epoxidase, chloroplastic-like [Musa acuminata AAA Group]|uniref:violaxanthin de-epoxidase, chloroplastic-like n=1 Tax=Musa acuminata AAA Group TaxID=214697 RepID=UPI0031DBEADF